MAEVELSKQVTDTLRFVAEQFTVNWHHVADYFNMHPEANKQLTLEGVRSLLRRLARDDYIQWKRLIQQTPSFVYVTPKTLKTLQLPYPEYEPKVRQTLPDGRQEGIANKHKNQINHVRLYLEKTYGRKIGWISERYFRFNQETNKDGTFPHRVDGLATLDDKDTAIEVEKAKKGVKRLEKIMLELMLSFEQSYYFCTQEDTYGLAIRVAGDIDPEGKHFKVFDWSDVA